MKETVNIHDLIFIFKENVIPFITRLSVIEWVMIGVICILFLWLMKQFIKRVLKNYRRTGSKHKKNIQKSEQVLSKLITFSHQPNGEARQIGYLRKVDPYVFEEIILTALKKQGHDITRNKRYSGDGGIDGECIIDGIQTLIQSKRYSNYIQPDHVINFYDICHDRDCNGLFIHTGKTGPKSKIWQDPRVDIISGDRLLNLICGRKVNFFQPKGVIV